ncbi:MAG TPA: FAD-dependent oxidoreductase, partial [Candidatus Dormibacteraeota bacterium]|nr:FAD-dependent oxidoreductase [Candidatus Dormibacteraeota bacterium]
MARTPLLSRLQQLFADLEESKRSGRSVEAVQEQRRQALTRRDFLKVTGATVGAAALSGAVPALARAQAAPPRIGIMGAGIAGLNAALTLQDQGLASTVFESSDRIGGRMHSLMSGYWLNGQTSEWCGELIDTNFKTIMSLASRFNLPLVDLLAAQPSGSQETDF